MANEKKTDVFISKLLEIAKIKYTPNGTNGFTLSTISTTKYIKMKTSKKQLATTSPLSLV